MAKKHVHTPGEWIVVADAGPAYKTTARYAPQIVAFRIHQNSTSTKPVAEGAIHVGETGINKAEYLAVLEGLRLLTDRMYVGDWDRDPVNVVTDSSFVVNQAVGNWEADELTWHLELLNSLHSEIGQMTGEEITFWHAGEGQNAGADTLSRSFRTICDQRQRDEWQRRRVADRWQVIRNYLRENQQAILAAGLASARINSYNGKTLTLAFQPNHSIQRTRVEARRADLRDAIQAVIGSAPREIRCVER